MSSRAIGALFPDAEEDMLHRILGSFHGQITDVMPNEYRYRPEALLMKFLALDGMRWKFHTSDADYSYFNQSNVERPFKPSALIGQEIVNAKIDDAARLKVSFSGGGYITVSGLAENPISEADSTYHPYWHLLQLDGEEYGYAFGPGWDFRWAK